MSQFNKVQDLVNRHVRAFKSKKAEVAFFEELKTILPDAVDPFDHKNAVKEIIPGRKSSGVVVMTSAESTKGDEHAQTFVKKVR
jgi:hypothetical protein